LHEIRRRMYWWYLTWRACILHMHLVSILQFLRRNAGVQPIQCHVGPATSSLALEMLLLLERTVRTSTVVDALVLQCAKEFPPRDFSPSTSRASGAIPQINQTKSNPNLTRARAPISHQRFLRPQALLPALPFPLTNPPPQCLLPPSHP
jgi:hypothetical protein